MRLQGFWMDTRRYQVSCVTLETTPQRYWWTDSTFLDGYELAIFTQVPHHRRIHDSDGLNTPRYLLNV